MKVFHRNFSSHKDALSASSSPGVPAIQRSGTTESQSEDGGDDKFARVHFNPSHVALFIWCRGKVTEMMASSSGVPITVRSATSKRTEGQYLSLNLFPIVRSRIIQQDVYIEALALQYRNTSPSGIIRKCTLFST